MNNKYENIIRRDFPWIINANTNDYCLILSDDVDSLVSCAILQKIFGFKINYFYDFSGLFCNKLPFLCSEPIGVDLALVRGKAICNHVTRISSQDSYNQEAVNLNLIDGVTAGNYVKKYAGSTALFLYSMFRKELKIKESPLLWAILRYYSAM